MKKHLLVLVLLTISIASSAQTRYKKGYFIDNANKQTECLIKDEDVQSTPVKFTYKLTPKSKSIVAYLKDIKEFGIDGLSKFIRYTVMIDKSSDELNMLYYSEQPIFKEKTLFLEVLVDGKAKLYEYKDGSYTKYFYQMDTHAPKQLVYKKFLTTANSYAENTSFQQQLKTDVNCDSTSVNYDLIKYNSYQLSNLFIEYNKCFAVKYKAYTRSYGKQIKYNIASKLGLRLVNFGTITEVLTSTPFGTEKEIIKDFDKSFSFSIGAENEFMLPVNNNKWSILFEPTFFHFSTTRPIENYSSNINYNTIELPFGLRHYMYLGTKTSIFINAQYQFNCSIFSKYTIDGHTGYAKIKDKDNATFGIGFQNGGRFKVEFRYQTNRDLLAVNFMEFKQSSASLLVGFKLK